MMGFTPGSFVQGMEAGQTRQNKQEQLKMQKTQMGMQQESHNMQMRQSESAMSMQEEQIQRLNNENEAFKKTINNQEKIKGQNTVKNWDAENPSRSLDSLNELSIVSGKGPLSMASEDAAKQYVISQGYETQHYTVDTDENGKEVVTNYSQAQLKDLSRTEEGRAKLQKINENAQNDLQEAVNSTLPYLVTSNDGAKTVSIEDIASVTGATLPKSYEDMLAKKSGMYIPSTESTSKTRRPTAFEEYDRYGAELADLKNKKNKTSADYDRQAFLTGTLDKKQLTANQIKERDDWKGSTDTFDYLHGDGEANKGWSLGNSSGSIKDTKAAYTAENDTKQNPDMYTPQLKKQEGDVRAKAIMVKGLERAKNQFVDIVGSNDFKSGIIDTPIQWLKERTPESIRKIMGMDTEQIQKQIGMKSVMGRALAERLKYYSGTAVADAEFQRTEEFLIGLSTMNAPDRVEATKAFFGAEVDSFKDDLNSLGMAGLPYSADQMAKSVGIGSGVSKGGRKPSAEDSTVPAGSRGVPQTTQPVQTQAQITQQANKQVGVTAPQPAPQYKTSKSGVVLDPRNFMKRK